MIRIEEHFRNLIEDSLAVLSEGIEGVMWDAYLNECTFICAHDQTAYTEDSLTFYLTVPSAVPGQRTIHSWSTPVTTLFANEDVLASLVSESWHKVMFAAQTEALEGLGTDITTTTEEVD